MSNYRCICNVFMTDREPEDQHHCEAAPTQEDLLCDECRVYDESCKAIRTEPNASSGIHSAGNTTHGGRHYTLSAYTRGNWGSMPGVGDRVVIPRSVSDV